MKFVKLSILMALTIINTAFAQVDENSEEINIFDLAH